MTDTSNEVMEVQAQEDTVDAFANRFGSGSAGTMGSEGQGDYEHVYNMNHKKRGLAIIINNRDFEKRTRMNKRSGTDVDGAYLYQRFSALGFECKQFMNQTTSQMLKLIQDVAKYDHSDCDCLVICILSHGDEGIIYGTDGIVQIDTLIHPVKGDNCKTLLGKPKLFFIQACRGNRLDDGTKADGDDEADAPPSGRRIPFEADVLLAFSTVPGYYSWRNSTKGSWFVQGLNRVLERYGAEKELMWLLTRTNHAVAYEFESNAAQEFMNQKKQIPCIQSMLTKEVYFRPKN